ncbi:PD-(D/E)XK nuclease family protein [Halorubrum tibetense]|uniref:PD-(D/E)XK nuclease family protein n=1 Tax=Halorubrum tibetense TaxID=175631 RepID=A0ABD5S8V4_9EURY
MPERLDGRLAEFKRQLDRLPEAETPPPTTLQVLGRGQLEQDWQRLLFHFLSPERPHGLDHAFLEHLLTTLADHDEVEYTFSPFDLTDIRVETEIQTSNERRPDAVMWVQDEWFICWELKVTAAEGSGQTTDYVQAEDFNGIDLTKDGVPTENHHYIYLAPSEASPPTADEFVPVSWEWMSSGLQSFLTAGHGKYPAETTAQLNSFIRTIRSELQMTEYQENQQQKAELYFDYYHEIREAESAFDSQWDEYADTWGTRLAESLDIAEVIELPTQPANQVAVEITKPNGESERWMFRQGGSDWAGLVKEGWWLDKADLAPIYAKPDDKSGARISLFHRLEQNRSKAVEDQTLELQLWHGTGNSDQFMYDFKDRIGKKIDKHASEIPPTTEATGRRGGPVALSYDIPVGDHDGFFNAYTAALHDAFLDIVIEYPKLITLIEEAFEESLEIYE